MGARCWLRSCVWVPVPVPVRTRYGRYDWTHTQIERQSCARQAEQQLGQDQHVSHAASCSWPPHRTLHDIVPTDRSRVLLCLKTSISSIQPEPPDGSVDILLILLCHSKFLLGLSSPPRLTLTGVCASSSSQEQRKALVVERICNAHARLKHAAAPRRWSMRRCCARRLDDPAEAWYFRDIRYVDGT
ncbi:hypothetical protein HDV57DRAFT_332413 [Trichoderma longibrachiatum]|uniref:Uncharacterized protein n=1 Tax=Trichoderma longibrachiatum ATCC 18648 TaxID=983965 RepID=A0A2T4BVG1_TRILO|nr:hypothetical protein M440DRAFT_128335 [Trichoderma longibrachiatum ATCC 18648]